MMNGELSPAECTKSRDKEHKIDDEWRVITSGVYEEQR